MKISELVASKDPETFLLGLRMLPKDFYNWCNLNDYPYLHGIKANGTVWRIPIILQSSKVWFENLVGETVVHYKDQDLSRFCYHQNFVVLIQYYENFRSNSSRKS